ncbi:uncharacterized protein LOC112559256 isoform X2 [Pomacea canaliculata]|uniref:uncharacterized protein LOC112559256 isoform X2 n=1 Tax=Pomacea canaliculata TaxID=400727 RepID=UPI000D72BC61|nr:uncharacterized protein LOC112559256 isoform X2 [Pomacea canaliculata]
MYLKILITFGLILFNRADDSTAGCHGDCGHEGICAGDHFCSLALHNEPYCRPCADILDHYCHNLTHIKDKFPQCLYYCEAEKKKKELEQELKTAKTPQTDVGLNTQVIVMCILLLAAISTAVIFAILYCRLRRQLTVSREPEDQPLMTTVLANSDTSQKELAVDMETDLRSPVSHPPAQPDTGYETASSNDSLNSTATVGSSSQQAVQNNGSNEDRSTNPGHCGHAGNGQVSAYDVTIRPDSQNTKVSILNNPTSDDRKYDKNVATNLSRHHGDDI